MNQFNNYHVLFIKATSCVNFINITIQKINLWLLIITSNLTYFTFYFKFLYIFIYLG